MNLTCFLRRLETILEAAVRPTGGSNIRALLILRAASRDLGNRLAEMRTQQRGVGKRSYLGVSHEDNAVDLARISSEGAPVGRLAVLVQVLHGKELCWCLFS